MLKDEEKKKVIELFLNVYNECLDIMGIEYETDYSLEDILFGEKQNKLEKEKEKPIDGKIVFANSAITVWGRIAGHGKGYRYFRKFNDLTDFIVHVTDNLIPHQKRLLSKRGLVKEEQLSRFEKVSGMYESVEHTLMDLRADYLFSDGYKTQQKEFMELLTRA